MFFCMFFNGFLNVWNIFAPQNYVVVEQLGAETTSLVSGRLIFCFQLLKDAELFRC